MGAVDKALTSAFGPNWKTTAAGLVAAVFGFIAFKPQHFPSILSDLAAYFAMGGLGVLGWQAKVKTVTGGTVLNTDAATSTPVGIAVAEPPARKVAT